MYYGEGTICCLFSDEYACAWSFDHHRLVAITHDVTLLCICSMNEKVRLERVHMV